MIEMEDTVELSGKSCHEEVMGLIWLLLSWCRCDKCISSFLLFQFVHNIQLSTDRFITRRGIMLYLYFSNGIFAYLDSSILIFSIKIN